MNPGIQTFTRMSIFRAPSARSTSSSSGPIVATPGATFTRIGRMASMKAVIIAGISPIQNQITKTGMMADFGTELNPISNG